MQETQELTTPLSGKKVLIRGYVTGLIDSEVQKILAGANKTKFEAPVDNISDPENIDANSFPPGTKVTLESDPTTQIVADTKLLELMVLAVDGNNGDVFNQLMALPKADVDFVKAAVKKLQSAGQLSDPKETN
jgi:hypothetical protein